MKKFINEQKNGFLYSMTAILVLAVGVFWIKGFAELRTQELYTDKIVLFKEGGKLRCYIESIGSSYMLVSNDKWELSDDKEYFVNKEGLYLDIRDCNKHEGIR